MKKSNTIWIDISELKNWTGSFTGIQRTVYNIAKNLVEDESLNVKLCRFDYRRKSFIESEYQFTEYVNTQPIQTIKQAPKRSLMSVVKKAMPTSLKRRIKSVISYTTPPYISVKPKVEFFDDDAIFLAGAFWTGQLAGVKEVQENVRVKVSAVMYDMVPVMMPELCTEVTVIDFNREVKQAINLVDAWVAISENTKNDLIKYAEGHKISIDNNKVSVIRLGSDINTDGPSKAPFTSKEQPSEFILFVSTIEARKNHSLVYQSIKLANEKGIKLPPIVFVGKQGWHVDDFASLLERDPEISESIIWLKNVDDASLRWLYQNCLFTIYPSLYEGWGLPVAESIAYGKFSIASRNSSIPEIAGNLIDYISPYSAQELVDKMAYFSSHKKELKTRTDKLVSVPQATWLDATNKIKETLLSL